MTNDNETPISSVDREAASKLNPLISSVDVRGTCYLVSVALKGLSHVVCENEKRLLPTEESLELFEAELDVLAAALDYEAAQEEPKPEAQEAPAKSKTKKHDYIVPLSPPPR